jgi:hypothetical protein
MPPIHPQYLSATVFLYDSKRAATSDTGFMAVGFFVRVPSKKVLGAGYTYLVTNEHVVRGMERIFARMHIRENPDLPSAMPLKRAEGFKVVEFKDFAVSKSWDLAICPYGVQKDDLYSFLPTEYLIRDYRGSDDRFAIPIRSGDEIFMVSRVVRKEIKYLKENLTVLRFGNVALCPKHEERMFLVEMRSIAGHSGSPVFVYEPPFAWGDLQPRKMGIRLLGINRGHLRDFEQLVSFDYQGKTVVHQRWFAETNMAISQVVPAWEICNMLNSGKLLKHRERSENALPVGGEITEDSKLSARQKLRPEQ